MCTASCRPLKAFWVWPVGVPCPPIQLLPLVALLNKQTLQHGPALLKARPKRCTPSTSRERYLHQDLSGGIGPRCVVLVLPCIRPTSDWDRTACRSISSLLSDVPSAAPRSPWDTRRITLPVCWCMTLTCCFARFASFLPQALLNVGSRLAGLARHDKKSFPLGICICWGAKLCWALCVAVCCAFVVSSMSHMLAHDDRALHTGFSIYLPGAASDGEVPQTRVGPHWRMSASCSD
jgi:hypothetical protein